MYAMTYILLSVLPALVTALAVLCTLVCMPLVWSALERPQASECPSDGWALALDAEMSAPMARTAPKRAPRRARHAPHVGACYPMTYTPRRGRAHMPRMVRKEPYVHVGYPDAYTMIGVFGVLARGVPTRNPSEFLRFLGVGGRGPPPPLGG